MDIDNNKGAGRKRVMIFFRGRFLFSIYFWNKKKSAFGALNVVN